MNLIVLALLLPLVFLIVYIVFLHKYGVLKPLKNLKKDQQKILIEDALKHFYDYEYNISEVSESSLSRYLSVNISIAKNVIEDMIKLGLILRTEKSFKLTENGKDRAAEIVRIHRLLEKYLAEKTGVSEENWHKTAEMEEHYISKEKANEIAAQLGNPLFDPHGDPIPYPKNKLLHKKEVSLTDLEVGQIAEIVHFEDEPYEVYRKIVEIDIYIGMHFRFVNKADNYITIESNGSLIKISADLLLNITVKPLQAQEFQSSLITLDKLQAEKKGEIYLLSKSLRGVQRRRILDMGIVPGTVIIPKLESIGKDPVAYLVRNTLIALRKQQARQILVRRVG